MRVHENSERAAAILLNAERHLESEREPGWHVSDLVGCLRKAWLRKNRPEDVAEDSADDRAVFLLGKSHHVLIQAAGEHCEAEVVLKLPTGDVHGTIDVMDGDWPMDRPTEIKTTRSNDLREPAFGMPQYLEQLAAYLLAVGQTQGTLAVLYIFATPPVLRVWDITFEEQELASFKTELEYRLWVVSQDDIIPMIGEHRRGECRTCPYLRKVCEGDLDGGRENFFNQANYTAWT